MTTVQPAEIAVATLLHIDPLLAFQGVMIPTTPTGCKKTFEELIVCSNSKFLMDVIIESNHCPVNSLLIEENWNVPPYSSTITSVNSFFLFSTADFSFSR